MAALCRSRGRISRAQMGCGSGFADAVGMTGGSWSIRMGFCAVVLAASLGCGGGGDSDGSAGQGGGGVGNGGHAGRGGGDAGLGGSDSGEAGSGAASGAGARNGEGGDPGAGGSAGSDGGPPDCISPEAPFEWPVARKPVAVPAHASWKAELELADEPFVLRGDTVHRDAVRWVKFTVLLSDPEKVYFQDSNVHAFHYDFATKRIPEFAGSSRSAFDAVTLQAEGQRAVLGAVLLPSDMSRHPEYAVQLVVNDALHPELARTIVENVAARVKAPQGTQLLYFPNPAQSECIDAHEAYFAEHDLRVGTVDQWLEGDACYAPGWAMGKLVELAPNEVDSAYLSGALRPEDVLLLSGAAPAELPYVAGILTLEPSTPNSHPAILARSYAVPFAYVRRTEAAARARALVGRAVVVATRISHSGDCEVRLIDVNELTAGDRETIGELAARPPIELAPKVASGAFYYPTAGLLPRDINRVGGKAAHFGLLAAAAPDNTPSPAVAFTFDLWDAFMAQRAPDGTAGSLKEAIARQLQPHVWPADLQALSATLDVVRGMIRDAPFPPALQQAVKTALAGFDPAVRIRFRSSTNVEDSATFTGAGLYDSVTGCLADDLDADAAGPSLCNPGEVKEHGVYRAIKRVFASFYAQNAYFQRLSRQVDEEQVGMAILAHYSVPDSEELANGVATLRVGPFHRVANIVSQVGAVSVTNPDGSARPETVTIERYGFGDYPLAREGSSLLLVGERVLTWESEYRTLMQLLVDAADAYARETGREPPFELDFEYKKVKPGVLSLRQMRPLPMPDTTADVTPFLVNEPVKLCVVPGEQSDVFAIHRLKTRMQLEAATGQLTAARLAAGLYDGATMDYVSSGETRQLSGNPAAFEGALHASSTEGVTDSWTTESGRWTLRTELARQLPRNECPVVLPEDFQFELSVQWAQPVSYMSFDEVPRPRTEEVTRLWASCPDTAALEPGSTLIEKRLSGPNVSIETSYWFPPLPRGVLVGYTAPLVKWEQTTIRGLTSTPIVLRDYYSQTFRPGHHNFSSEYIFEPGLEPGIPAATLAELEAANVKFIYVANSDDSGLEGSSFWVAGMTGELRRLAAP